MSLKPPIAASADIAGATFGRTPQSLPFAVGESLLHYQIQAKLGEGGMGIVYKALDQKLNRLVALKFLPPQIDASGVHLQRFLQEANALSALNHPNIATIYAVETAGDRQFLSMEFLPGGTLKAELERIKNGGTTLSLDEVLKYAQQTAEGLAHAHAHRSGRREDYRLRGRQADGFISENASGRPGRNHRIHVARTSARHGGGCQIRSVFIWSGSLRVARGTSALPGAQRRRDADADYERAHSSVRRGSRRCAKGAGADCG